MKRIIFITSIIFILVGCGNDSQEQAISKNIKYTISEDSHKRNIKRNVVVILDERISEEDLYKLANAIKKSDRSEYERTFIGYYLRGEEGQGYWATTNFDPDLRVNILGLSQVHAEQLSQPITSTPGRKILGSWIDDRPGVGRRIVIYYSNDETLYLENTYADGSQRSYEMIVLPMINGKRIEEKDGNEFGEYFVINQAGQLEFWGTNGKYYTAKSIQ